MRLTFLPFTVCTKFLCSVTLCNTSFLTRSVNWSSPSFFSTTFRNFPNISDLLSQVSRFQHHMNLYYKYNTLLVSSLHVGPNMLVKRATWCAVNSAWTGLGSNPILHVKRPATKGLSHCTITAVPSFISLIAHRMCHHVGTDLSSGV